MQSAWSGRTMVSEGTLVTGSAATARVREVYSISEDRKVLTIEVTRTDGGAARTSRLQYTPLARMAPCQQWPTPCKR